MNTFQLQCFLAVARNLNFAKAAEELNVTQPAVTHQIQTLEEEFNAKLFKRTTRNVELTQSGHMFINDAENVLKITDRAKSRFKTPSSGDIRFFTVGCQNNAILFHLAEPLKKMNDTCLNFHPQFKVVPFNHLFRLLEEEDVDAVVTFKEDSSVKNSALYKEIVKVPVCCLCSIENQLANRKSVSMSELKNENLILGAPVKIPPEIRRIQGELMDGKPFSELFFCEMSDESNVLVKAGFGIAIVPELLIQPSVKTIKIPIKDAPAISFGVYYKSAKRNIMVKNFIEAMKLTFSE